MAADFQAPSLFGDSPPPRAGAAGNSVISTHEARSLLDLLYDGFYLVFLLRNHSSPSDPEAFRSRIKQFLTGFERGGRRLAASTEDIHLAKFAYCALIDEVVLMSRMKMRDMWERKPLQLEFFGEQLAGERFFEQLETLRQGGAARIQVLEVYHMCLLLGFQGKYVIEGTEKLNYLTARLGDEIAHLRGKRVGFAPKWQAPDRVSHALKREIPVWVIGSVFAFLALVAYTGLHAMLNKQTQRDLGEPQYAQIVKLPPHPAFITITLP